MAKTLKLQRRRDLMDGWVLSPSGATVGDAVRTADISNPANRERLVRKGFQILTRHNANSTPAELQTEPPDVEVIARALEAVSTRKGAEIARLEELLAEAKTEMKQPHLSLNERSFWHLRAKRLEEKIAEIKSEQVMAAELYRALVLEDVAERAKAVPPEMRAAIEALERERAVHEMLDVEEA